MAEQRLIDANALYREADNLENAVAEKCGWQEECDGISQVKDLIVAAPTIDAAPVVHGRWVWFENRPVADDEDPECIGITGYECSECGNNDSTCIRFYEELSVYSISCIKEGLKESLTNYCPSCGAKMDAADNNVGHKD